MVKIFKKAFNVVKKVIGIPFVKKAILRSAAKLIEDKVEKNQLDLIFNVIDKIETEIKETEIKGEIEGVSISEVKYKKDLTQNFQVEEIISKAKDSIKDEVIKSVKKLGEELVK